jgi:teichuronic acid biosynthesis glycosyltransferase TuaG
MPPESAGSSLPVTVIVPAYNASASLQRAISSVLAQSQQAAEIIIVDDASSDDTWNEIERLRTAVVGPKLVTIRLAENLGAADARNAAWDVATQQYVAFLDADDFWHPRKLEVQYQ